MRLVETNALTARELLEMSEEELKQVYSACWHDGDYSETRCEAEGISHLSIEKSPHPCGRYNVSYGDGNGDPSFQVLDLDEKIHKTGDGTWDYGLYIDRD